MKIALINYLKKALAVLLVLIVAIMNVSCKSDDKPNDGNTLLYVPETTLTIYTVNILYEMDDAIEEMEARLKNYLNVKLNIKSISEFCKKKGYDPYSQENRVRAIEDLLRSDEPCDAIQLSIDDLRLIDKSLLQDISDIFPAEAPELHKYYDDGALKSASYEGRLYGVPSMLPVSQKFAFYVKKDAVEKYNIKKITNLDAYEELLREISSYNNRIYPGTIYPMRYYMLSSGYVDIGGYFVYRLDDPEMKLIPWEQTEAFRESISRFHYWSKQNYIVDLERIGESGSIGIQELYYYHENMKYFDVFVLDEDKVFPMEANTKALIAFNRNSPNIGKVLKFLEWTQSSQENYDLFTYGIENKHYTLVNGKLKNAKNLRNFYTLINPKYERDIYGYSDNYAKWYVENTTKNTIYPKHTGFIISNKLMEKIRLRNEEFQTKIIEPSPVESIQWFDINEFIKEQKEKGVDDLLKELQRELDEWYMKYG